MTPQQIELVKSTVPVLREHGVALTSYFYKRMLAIILNSKMCLI
jgi:nitric oxide dioxygenase